MLATADLCDAKPVTEIVPANRGKRLGSFFLPKDYPEVQLYCLLKARFGRPNGFLSLLIHPNGDPDAPYKWDFIFVPCGNLNLHILRSVNGLEIEWWGEDCTQKDVMEFLESNLKKHADKVAGVFDSLERMTLLMNPYARHSAIVKFALDEIKTVKVVEPVCPASPAQEGASAQYHADFMAFIEAINKQASLAMTIVTESAFMAESFFNLLIALNVRPEIRASKSAMKETLYRNWKQKVERLHIDCNYIKPVNLGDSRIRDAGILFDTRNRIAHSYPDVEDLAVSEVYFDRSVPVMPTSDQTYKYTVMMLNQLPSVEEALFCAEAAKNLVQYLVELLDPKVSDSTRIAMLVNPLGYNQTKKCYSVPFGPRSFVSMISGGQVGEESV